MDSVESRKTKRGLSVLFLASLLAIGTGAVGCGDDEGGTGGGTGGGSGGGAGGGSGDPDAGVEQELLVDTDVALVKLNADGSVDTTYGTNGVAIVSFGDGYDSDADGLVNFRDSLVTAALDANENVILFGTKKAANGNSLRIDNDRVTARVLADGSGLDATFGAPVDSTDPTGPKTGMNVVDVGGLNDNVRGGSVLADGTILAAGYTSQPTGFATTTANRIVLARITTAGVLDASFGAGTGVVNFNPFARVDEPSGMAEAYGAAVQSTNRIVTAGYGRSAASGQVNFVSVGFDADGTLDDQYSNDANDAYDGTFEFATDAANDRARNILAIADDSLVAVGSGEGDANARIVVLDADGALDTGFDTDGVWLHDFGFPSEHLYGVAYEPTDGLVAACGYGSDPAADDDALLAIVDPADTSAPVTEVAAFSADAADRCWSVTFDADGKVLVAGFVVVDGDSHMLVARFEQDGSLDAAFGDDGVARINVAALADLPVGGLLEEARSVLVLADGSLLVAGTTEVVRPL